MISPTAGFHMNSFKVSGFNLFPTASSPTLAAPGTTSLFPTADLGTYGASAKPLRNAVYSLVARNRYRIFGKYEECFVPDAEMRARVME